MRLKRFRFPLMILPVLLILTAATPSLGSVSQPLSQPAQTALIDEFGSPFGDIPTTTQYDTQWNIITADSRYGVRNFSLPGTPRKCWNVTWPRLLHSGIDLYRLDGQDAANTPVVAVANGSVAYYDPTYTAYPGHVVILRHPLSDGRVIYSMYAHLATVSVVQGQIIQRGQPIGTVLYQPEDSHLHFELRWFLDGTWIYPSSTACNGLVYGRGYTYLIHPDDFYQGYVDPDAFIQAHGGAPLTPIGLPDPRKPKLTIEAASVDVNVITEANRIEERPGIVRPAPYDVGGPDTSDATDPIKVAPALNGSVVLTTPVLSTLSIAAPTTAIITEPLTYTAYLPLVATTVITVNDGSCVAGQELLLNGGFEDGASSAPWVQVKNSAAELISTTQPFSGTYSLWLGGRNTADEEVLQSFVVPTYTEALTLTLKRLLTTQETEPLVYDHFEFVLENPVGNEVSPQVSFTNLSPNRNKWVAETIVFNGLQDWVNHRLRLSIKGMTDSNLLTHLFVDDVSLRTQCRP